MCLSVCLSQVGVDRSTREMVVCFFQGALIEASEVENPRDPSLFEGPDKDRQVSNAGAVRIQNLVILTNNLIFEDI